MHALRSSSLARPRVRFDTEGLASAAVTIARDQEQLFEAWANPRVLPTILNHLHALKQVDARPRARERSDDGPGLGRALTLSLRKQAPPRWLEWAAEWDDQPLYRAAASFHRAPRAGGTELRVSLELSLEGLGPIERLKSRYVDFLLREDLRNFKHQLEAGEYPTTRGQPSGQRSLRGRALTSLLHDSLQRELLVGDAELRSSPGNGADTFGVTR